MNSFSSSRGTSLEWSSATARTYSWPILARLPVSPPGRGCVSRPVNDSRKLLDLDVHSAPHGRSCSYGSAWMGESTITQRAASRGGRICQQVDAGSATWWAITVGPHPCRRRSPTTPPAQRSGPLGCWAGVRDPGRPRTAGGAAATAISRVRNAGSSLVVVPPDATQMSSQAPWHCQGQRHRRGWATNVLSSSRPPTCSRHPATKTSSRLPA